MQTRTDKIQKNFEQYCLQQEPIYAFDFSRESSDEAPLADDDYAEVLRLLGTHQLAAHLNINYVNYFLNKKKVLAEVIVANQSLRSLSFYNDIRTKISSADFVQLIAANDRLLALDIWRGEADKKIINSYLTRNRLKVCNDIEAINNLADLKHYLANLKILPLFGEPSKNKEYFLNGRESRHTGVCAYQETKDIISYIDAAQENPALINNVTRTAGLREKVKSLLGIENKPQPSFFQAAQRDIPPPRNPSGATPKPI